MTHPVGKKHENRSNAHRRQREVSIGMLAIHASGFFAAVMANVAAMGRAVRFPRKTGEK